jgi:hypothetical protein
MKLSARELKFLSEIETRRVRRRRDAWIFFLATILLTVLANKVEMFAALHDTSILTVGITFAGIYLAHTYFAVRPEDRLVGLLQRYVHQDPEAVAQLAGSTAPDEITEKKGVSPTT